MARKTLSPITSSLDHSWIPVTAPGPEAGSSVLTVLMSREKSSPELPETLTGQKEAPGADSSLLCGVCG